MIFSSCEKNLFSGPAKIRVHNISDYDVDEIRIWDHDLGSLAKGKRSDYFEKDPAYDIASLLVRVDTFNFALTVIDYVGVEPLSPGKYTFQVDISELSSQGHLTQVFVED